MKRETKDLCCKCGYEMKLYKEDEYRWWYKCINKECTQIQTEPKPLTNKSIKSIPHKKA